jgi:hypothetical protein
VCATVCPPPSVPPRARARTCTHVLLRRRTQTNPTTHIRHTPPNKSKATNLDVGVLFLEVPASTRDGAAGAHAADQEVNLRSRSQIRGQGTTTAIMDREDTPGAAGKRGCVAAPARRTCPYECRRGPGRHTAAMQPLARCDGMAQSAVFGSYFAIGGQSAPCRRWPSRSQGRWSRSAPGLGFGVSWGWRDASRGMS